MARSPDGLKDKARELFESGILLIDIANQLSVPEGTVRSWKNRYKWECNATPKKECNVAMKPKKNKPIADEVKQVIDNPELTDKQRLFCLYYSKSFNAGQSYAKAYGCSYESAIVNASRLLTKDNIKAELKALRELKLQQSVAGVEDMIDLHMRIAFADMGNYVSFGLEEVPFTIKGIPVYNPDGTPKTVKYNTVKLNESANVDTQLIKEIKEGKEGISVKLLDRCNSLDWLDRYFLMNPLDRHKIEYDKRKLELELIKLDYGEKSGEPSATQSGGDNFLDALNAKALEVWNDEE